MRWNFYAKTLQVSRWIVRSFSFENKWYGKLDKTSAKKWTTFDGSNCIPFNCDWCAKERVTYELYTNTYSCNKYARRPSSRENLSIVSGVRTPVFVSFSVLDRFVNAVTHFSAVLAFFPFIISRLLSWKRDVCKLIAIGGRRLRKRETIKSETHTNTHLMRAFVSSL